MIDPLSEVVTLLQPTASSSKIVSGAGPWTVRRAEYGKPFFCVMLEGTCRIEVEGHESIMLREGDFILLPSAAGFTMSGHETAASEHLEPPTVSPLPGEVRHGVQSGLPDVRLLIGYCVFGSPDAALLVSLIPEVIHVRGVPRLTTIVQLVGDEYRASRPAREAILSRLLEVLLVEALRSTSGIAAPPGLLRGLADEQLALAIRRMHENPSRPWTVAQLAEESALSRSAFFERFRREMGVAPMEYLLAWRMAMAKNLLRRQEGNVGEVAERVGYGSASAFSVAFTRHVGVPPAAFAREQINGGGTPAVRSSKSRLRRSSSV